MLNKVVLVFLLLSFSACGKLIFRNSFDCTTSQASFFVKKRVHLFEVVDAPPDEFPFFCSINDCKVTEDEISGKLTVATPKITPTYGEGYKIYYCVTNAGLLHRDSFLGITDSKGELEFKLTRGNKKQGYLVAVKSGKKRNLHPAVTIYYTPV